MEGLAQTDGVPGTIFAYRFDAHGKAIQIGENETVSLETPDAGFVWLHLNLADQRARDWITDAALLDTSSRDCLLANDNHQALHHREDKIWGVFVDLMQDFDGVTDSMGYLRFAMGERYLISGRRHALQAIESTRKTLSSGRMLAGPAALLEALVDHATDGLSGLVAELISEVDGIEDRVLENHFHKERERLGPLRRREVAVHRQLNGMLSIFRQLAPSLEKAQMTDLHGSVTRLVQRIEALHHEIHSIMGRTRLLQEEIASKLTTETNDHLYVLTVLTTVLLPPTLITGIFGMNTGGLPLKETDWGTPVALAICAGSSLFVFLLLRFLQRRGAM